MFKYLVIIFVIILGLIYVGNYIDLRNHKINKKEYDRRIRFFIVLIFILIGILVWIKRK
ncbi:Ca2+/Na+ antiporter [Pedobacter africanus]|uniref:Ca2+/Na+ antiporter n=1 Tax=Pedobacter africanus TaxID=151894 RepID=A0ACC6KRV6_9SPHI|nr:Ca2+/Na+ antiporter [Pedobacter africanus]